jgi:cardiolipin synthase
VRALERAVGARQVGGNAVRLQVEGAGTFETWLDAIDGAERFVHFENYILRDDRVGRAFRDALTAKARQGVPVRVLHDWVGCWATRRGYWKPFREAGVEVRAFNPPSLRDPFGLLQRDHRKLVCVDGRVAYVGGFCVGEEWAGGSGAPPWRDTGVEIRGPAATVAARAFETIWAKVGEPVAAEVRARRVRTVREGTTPVWIIQGIPWRSRVYRATQLVAASAKRRIWITDPYFVAPRPVAEALAAAALDGVDVRILVPGHNNWPWVGSLSRGGYRSLLRAGVRIFEWQGSMIHAKTAVADSIWSRVGSSNLNAASLLGNWEIDVGILDRSLAEQLEATFLADLTLSVEIVLPRRARQVRRSRLPEPPVAGEAPRQASLEPPERLQDRLEHWRSAAAGSMSWSVADLVRAGSTLGDAIAGHRTLGREDRAVLSTVSAGLLVAALLAAVFPWVVGWAVALLLGWLGIVVSVRVLVQVRRGRREEATLKSLESHLVPEDEPPLVAEGHDRYHPDEPAAGVEEKNSTEAE